MFGSKLCLDLIFKNDKKLKIHENQKMRSELNVSV